jgi:endonuclease/exonuclease/phosphatase family metal-dependent hydrolase
VGTDGRLDVGRVADAIAAYSPDIVALQEVDVGRRRTGGIDQAHQIAERLGMGMRFHPALRVEQEYYGDAILTALPERLIKAGPLPGYPRLPQLEPRGALWVAIDIQGTELEVLNTHLGLVPREQEIQARALVGPDWLASREASRPLIVLGDFNAVKGGAVYRTVLAAAAGLRTASPDGRAIATYPSLMPMLQLDHVFVSDAVTVRSIRAPTRASLRRASDHLPLVVEFDIAAR